MRKYFRLLTMSCLVHGTAALAQTCEDGGAAAIGVAAQPSEYARGEAKTIQIEDDGKLRPLSYVKVRNHAVFEGDVILGDANQLEFDAQLGPVKLQTDLVLGPSGYAPFGYVARWVLSGTNKWSNNTIPYIIDPSLDEAPVIAQAIAWWEQATKIRFTAITPATLSQYPNHVYFTVGADPNACLPRGVGMMGGRQTVELVRGCGLGQIAHEIGHIIGLQHEQNRSDRDSFVRVVTANILQGYAPQFQKRPDLYKDDGPYDLDSIMHYESSAYSCNRQSTIVPLNALPPGVIMGQRDHISRGDAAIVNSIYK